MSDKLTLSDAIRNAPKFGKNFAFDRWTAFLGVGFFRPRFRLNECVGLSRIMRLGRIPGFLAHDYETGGAQL